MNRYVFPILALVVVAASAGLAWEHIVGGPYTGGNTLPFWAQTTYYPEVRWQCLWRQTDINFAGYVYKIEFLAYPTTLYGGTFNGCKMLLAHCSAATLTATYADNYAGTPVTIYDGDYVAPVPAPDTWATIFETTTYSTLNYNNADNLVFEVSWTGWSGGGRNDYRCCNSGGYGGRVYSSSATATTGTLNMNYSQYGRLTVIPKMPVEPTSLGRVKAMFN